MVSVTMENTYSETLALLFAEVTELLDRPAPLPSENLANISRIIVRFQSEIGSANTTQREHARSILIRLEKRLRHERNIHKEALRSLKKQEIHLRAAQSWAKGQLQIL